MLILKRRIIFFHLSMHKQVVFPRVFPKPVMPILTQGVTQIRCSERSPECHIPHCPRFPNVWVMKVLLWLVFLLLFCFAWLVQEMNVFEFESAKANLLYLKISFYSERERSLKTPFRVGFFFKKIFLSSKWQKKKGKCGTSSHTNRDLAFLGSQICMSEVLCSF